MKPTSRLRPEARVRQALEETSGLLSRAAEDDARWVVDAAGIVTRALRAGRKVLFCGNGGSAADAQHLAAELSGKFYFDRPGLPAVALTTNTSALTAIANDFDYETVFERQVDGLGKRGDVLVAISTSGKSPSILRAMKTARRRGLVVIGLTGAGGRPMVRLSHHCLRVPSKETPRIQEVHIAVGHLLCELVERALFVRR
jgi:D-sedoheptulose 7-phosphate isomerase